MGVTTLSYYIQGVPEKNCKILHDKFGTALAIKGFLHQNVQQKLLSVSQCKIGVNGLNILC